VNCPKNTLFKEVYPVKVVLNSDIAVVHGRLLAKYVSQQYGAMFTITEQGSAGQNLCDKLLLFSKFNYMDIGVRSEE
jgi:hypothetical protein